MIIYEQIGWFRQKQGKIYNENAALVVNHINEII